MKNDEEGEGMEPDELGTRMVEHGESVSVNGCLHWMFLNSTSRSTLQMKLRLLGHLGLKRVWF